MTDLPAWIEGRRPPAPVPLAGWLATRAAGRPASPEALLEAGLEALDRARARPGRVRASAYELLGADALLTYACEAALEAVDPAPAFEAMIRATAAAHR